MPACCAPTVVATAFVTVFVLSGQAAAQVVADGGGNRTAVPVPVEVTYRAPVEGLVVRGFEAPTTYGPGHRGLDLHAPAGTQVGAAAAGRVTFAGTVADIAWVTIRHADGVRTSYGHLGQVLVDIGQDVVVGQVLGVSAGDVVLGRPHVHFGARDDDGYLDPARLLRPALVRVRIDRPGHGRVVDDR